MNFPLRLGVNIDHVATVRNARGVSYPDPLRAAGAVSAAGAHSITVHLREDRRHIRDDDVVGLVTEQNLPVNLEIAPVSEMVDIALSVRPYACCFVPERRAELTTEGGLDVIALSEPLTIHIQALREAEIRTSLFIEPHPEQIMAARDAGADCVELHTGSYAQSNGSAQARELERLRIAADMAYELGLECHAGHGLTYDNVVAVAALRSVCELNIGHFLVGEAVFTGLETAIRHMMKLMDEAAEMKAVEMNRESGGSRGLS